jgi:hypothetical protein
MALGAGNELVTTQKRETRQAVVESLAGNSLPAIGAVAGCAVIAKTAEVDILMASGAIVKWQTSEFDK